MKHFNVVRWLLGGVLAGLVIWILEGALSGLYIAEMTARMSELGLAMNMSVAHVAGSIASTILGGLVMVFFYALLRAPLGAGPYTAAIIALAMFCGGYLPGLIRYYLLGLFDVGLLLHWGAQGLVEMTVAAVVGTSIYTPRVVQADQPVT